jgi:hypothetical protein
MMYLGQDYETESHKILSTWDRSILSHIQIIYAIVSLKV